MGKQQEAMTQESSQVQLVEPARRVQGESEKTAWRRGGKHGLCSAGRFVTHGLVDSMWVGPKRSGQRWVEFLLWPQIAGHSTRTQVLPIVQNVAKSGGGAMNPLLSAPAQNSSHSVSVAT
jgi:hypothetical protein